MRRVPLLVFVTAFLLVVVMSPRVTRQETARAQAIASEPKSAVAVNFAESIPIRDLPVETTQRLLGENDYERPNKELPKSVNATETGDADGAIGPLAVAGPAPGPLSSFDGVSNQDNFNSFGFRLSPPDTDGEIGPDHFVQYVNLLFRVYSRTGTPLTGPVRLSTLFAPLGGQCAEPDNGDPIALYDQLADRWILSQFAFAGSGTEPPYHECIAVSKTSDPTGAYYLYDFMVPTVQFNDYPKLGVWPDGYYMTANQFNRGLSFDGTGAFAFNRRKMLVGDPTANMIYFDLNLATHPEAIGGMLPSDLDGLTPPYESSPNVFVYFLATEFLDAIDGLRFFDFHADFNNPSNSTFVERQAPLPVPAFDPRSPAGRADIEQPAPAIAAHSLDAISDRLMFRLAYRNFGTHESLVVNHSVNVGTGTTLATHQSGVRYYELRREGKASPFGIHVAETISPNTDNRWMASAAQDNDGNIAVGYSVSSLVTFPSVRYSGRLADGTPRTEASLIEGSGVQRSTGSRWGDYSAISVDPLDDCTFWYTNEYYTAASQATSTVGWLTRIGNFKFDECTPAPRGTLTGKVTDAYNGLPVAGALIDLGRGIMTSTEPDGTYTMYLLPGKYGVVASSPNYRSKSGTASITNGGTATLDFVLDPIGADVFVTKTGPARAPGGTNLTYAITVGNNGPRPSFDVAITDPIPAGTSFVSVVPTNASCKTPDPGGQGEILCILRKLDVGATETLIVTLRGTDPAGHVNNVVSVKSWITKDETPHNNSATATTLVTCGEDVTVTAGPIGTAATNGLQVGRLFRSGAPSVCAFPKAFPGFGATTGDRKYDAYQYTNEGTTTACVTVEITAGASCASNLLYAAAYLGSFNPVNISQNFLADSGSSPSPAAGVPTVAFSFNVPSASSFTLVVHEVNPQPTTVACGAYSFVVRDVPEACVLTSSAAPVGLFSTKPH
jgi:uncharacterized repeat protein (TIGR01451 family)